MAKKVQQAADNAVFEKITQETKNLLAKAVPAPDKQLLLFEEFAQANEQIAQKNPKTKDGLTFAQEIFSRLVAAGHSQTEAYLKAYPACKTTNLNTVYSKASHLAKLDKVGARISALKEKTIKEALMPTTELYQRLTEMARNGGKAEIRLKAAELIGKIYGVFQPDKETSVIVSPSLMLQTVDFSKVASSADDKAVGTAQSREDDK